jgi:tRNA A-37 threonylcarbamoyl transferase component Bud32
VEGRSSERVIHVLCKRCGRPWPASQAVCTFDGTRLNAADVHTAETILIPGRRENAGPSSDAAQPHAIPAADTLRDVRSPLPAESLGAPRMIAASAPESSAFDSDEATRAELRRFHVEVTAPRGVEVSSSGNFSTVVNRKHDDHIDLPRGAVIDDLYEIERRVGQGAMGDVYEARHVQLRKRVAVKVISRRLSADAEAMSRFGREAQTLAQMQHPNIVDVSGFGTLIDGRAYFVMEFLDGVSLEERLGQGRVPLGEAVDVLDQVCRGLEVAHRAGIVHRDVKPANVFLARVVGEARPTVKLLDFGLSKWALETSEVRRVEQTATGVVLGTPLYISPEQAQGPHVDYRSDIYALGCVAFELLLGVVPFPAARTVPALLAAHFGEVPPLPRTIWPQIPPQLDLLLFALLAKRPEQRPELAQVRQVLASARGATVAATQVAATRAATEVVGGRQSPRWLVPAMVFGGVVVGGVIGAAVRGSPTESPPRPVDPGAPLTITLPALPTTALPAPVGSASEHAVAAKPTSTGSASTAVAGGSDSKQAPAGPPPPPLPGHIVVTCASVGKLLLDGAATGVTLPASNVSIPAAVGRHKITFDLGADRYSFTVVIAQPGETRVLTKSFAP